MQRPAKGIKITGVLSPCDPRCFDPGGCKEGSAMAPFAVRSSMPRTFLLVVGCVLACAFLQPAVALAQRAVAHPAAGGRVVSPRVLVPPVQPSAAHTTIRSEEHTSELQSRLHLVCRLLLEKKKKKDVVVLGLPVGEAIVHELQQGPVDRLHRCNLCEVADPVTVSLATRARRAHLRLAPPTL